jgi:hypothetical protein
MDTKLIIILILILLIFSKCVKNETFQVVKTSKNGKEYTVQEYPNEQEAADILEQLESNINTFLNGLKTDFPDDERIKRMSKNLKSSIIEEAPHKDGESAYTINKGELMKICLRKKIKDKPFHTLNTLMFVVIHELAHVISISIGHNEEFMTNFRFLLREAPKYDIDYEPINYSKNNITYCGVDVTHNPYYNHV